MAPDTVTVTMLTATGQGPDSQWFDLRPTFYGGIVRVEWDLDTMEVELPRDTAELLVRQGYAKVRGEPREAPRPGGGRKPAEKEKPNDPG